MALSDETTTQIFKWLNVIFVVFKKVSLNRIRPAKAKLSHVRASKSGPWSRKASVCVGCESQLCAAFPYLCMRHRAQIPGFHTYAAAKWPQKPVFWTFRQRLSSYVLFLSTYLTNALTRQYIEKCNGGIKQDKLYSNGKSQQQTNDQVSEIFFIMSNAMKGIDRKIPGQEKGRAYLKRWWFS